MKTDPAVLAAVAVGGAVGALARYGVGRASAAIFGAGWPWGTLIVNVAGCFAMGLLYFWLEARAAAALKAFLLVGVLGAFTTFSAFTLDAALLLRDRSLSDAGLYVAASVALSLAGFAIGAAAGRALA